jgi:hypothetical protein
VAAKSIRYEYGFYLKSSPAEVVCRATDTSMAGTAPPADWPLDDPPGRTGGRLGRDHRTCPPIFFYLDAVDEEFSHAPIACSAEVLFYQVMRFLRITGGRAAHCMGSPHVTSSVARSEHAPRYRTNRHRMLTTGVDRYRARSSSG